MRTSTHRRLSVATTEQLLDGAPGTTHLHRLLAAATRPGSPEELSGATAAHAAFVAAIRTRPLPGETPRGEPMSKLLLSKILAAKAIAALVLLGGATGVAVATTATSGPPETLPATASDRATPGGPAAGAPDVADPAEAEDGSPASAAADEPADATAGDDTTGPTPSPSLHGLCNAYSAGAAEDPEKLAKNPAFGALVTAAGGPTQVAGFCAGLEDTGGKQATAEDPAVDDASGDPEETAETAETAHGNSDGHEPPAGAGKEKVRR